jgi:hypothetical protein
MSRSVARIALFLTIAPACARPAVQEPSAPVQVVDAWQTTVPVSSAEAYSAVLGVLADSNYLIRLGDAASGVVETRPRRVSDVRRAVEESKVVGFASPPDAAASTVRYAGSNYPITLRAVVRPAGEDSAHIAIVGDYAIHNQTAHIVAGSTEWRYLVGVGRAVLTRVRSAPR